MVPSTNNGNIQKPPNASPTTSNSYLLFSSFIRSIHFKYTVIPAIFLSYVAVISADPNAWVVTHVDHFYFEMFAVVFSVIIAFYSITRAYTLNEKFSLFVGIGFLTIAIIDFLHATLSYSAAGKPDFLRYFIPQTWFAGRTFLGAMLVIAFGKYIPAGIAEKKQANDEQDNQHSPYQIAATKVTTDTNSTLRNTILLFLVLIASLAISVVAISFFTVFPGIVTDYDLHRPYEVPSLILFSIALFYFYKNKFYKINDVFYKGILCALIIDIFGQIIMSYSGINFHTAHNIAHILKNSAYFIIVISLALSSIQHNRIAKQREATIRMQYDRLKEADKMKDEFINIAAHELRTPIQPIIGLTEIIQSRMKSDSQDKELLNVIARNAKRLENLTEDLLDFAKIESGSLKLTLQSFNLNEVILNIIEDIFAGKNLNAQKKKEVKILYEPKDVFVKADKTRINQVISNLLSNALKFTAEGYISIMVDRIIDNQNELEEAIIVSICDSGKGIDPAMLPRLFAKFCSNSHTGTGLGLYISKNIIEAHGGRIWAENNDRYGKRGATFTFVLPAS